MAWSPWLELSLKLRLRHRLRDQTSNRYIVPVVTDEEKIEFKLKRNGIGWTKDYAGCVSLSEKFQL